MVEEMDDNYSDKVFLYKYISDFAETIGGGYIWQRAKEPSR